MRKEMTTKVLAKVQQTISSVLGSNQTLSYQTLVDVAQSFGYVAGRRGVGYLATDEGLTFLGEDLEAFKVREAQAEAAANEHAKESAKAKARARKEALQHDISEALTTL